MDDNRKSNLRYSYKKKATKRGNKRRKIFLIILLVSFFLFIPVLAQNHMVSDNISLAFRSLEKASSNGGDVSNLVLLLNEVVDSVKSGDYDEEEMDTKIDFIINKSEIINQDALDLKREDFILRISILLIIIFLEVLIWRLFPKVYWQIWLKKYGDWIISESR